MKPIEFDVRPSSNEKPFQEVRRKEVIAFISCGAKYAEVEMSNEVTVGREVECYRRAIRQVRAYNKVRAFQKNYKVYLERMDIKAEEI